MSQAFARPRGKNVQAAWSYQTLHAAVLVAILGALSSTLAGCANMPWNTHKTASTVQLPPTPAPQPVVAPPPPVASVTPASKPVERRKLAPPAAVAPPVVVIGLSQEEVRRALGEPQQRIDKAPGQAWVYSQAGCSVEILFFLDVTRNGYYALDRKVTGTDGSETASQQCFQHIQNARQN